MSENEENSEFNKPATITVRRPATSTAVAVVYVVGQAAVVQSSKIRMILVKPYYMLSSH